MQRFELESGSVEATRRALGGVMIERIPQDPTGHWVGHAFITLADSTFNQSGLRKYWGPRIAIAHELAHYWDWKTGEFWSKVRGEPGVSGGMPSAVGKELGPTWYARVGGIVEDWAESVAGYLFPEYFSILQAEGNPMENRTSMLPSGHIVILPPGLGPRHRAYVAAQFQALKVSALP